MKSRRAAGVISSHAALVFGAASASAFLRSAGTTGSGSCADRAISKRAMFPTAKPADARSASSILSQCPPRPSGWSVAANCTPLIEPSTLTGPRDGRARLAGGGILTKAHDSFAATFFGRRSAVLNRIFGLPLESPGFRFVGLKTEHPRMVWPKAPRRSTRQKR